MQIIRSFLLLIFLLPLVSSCHFSPLYNSSNDKELNDILGSIEVEPIDSVIGAEFCYHLSELMNVKKIAPKYLLKITLAEGRSPIAIQKNSDVLRQNIELTVKYTLYDIHTHKEITSGIFRNLSSYNTTTSVYSANVESEANSLSLTKRAAEEIRTKLVLYLKLKKL